MIWVMDSIPWVRCASGNVFLQNPNSGISYYFRIPIFLVIRIVFPEFLQFCFDHQLTSATCIHIWHWLRFARDRYKLASSNVLIWYHHQPESHQQSFTKFLDIETPGPIDRTPETPGSGKNWKWALPPFENFPKKSSIICILSVVQDWQYSYSIKTREVLGDPSPMPKRFLETQGSSRISRSAGVDLPIVPDFWWSTAVLFIINPQMRIESLAHTSSIYAITSLLSPGYTCPAKCVSTVNTLNGHWSVLSKYWRQVSFNILTRSLGATGAQLLVDI